MNEIEKRTGKAERVMKIYNAVRLVLLVAVILLICYGLNRASR